MYTDICASRDDAQPHIVENNRCVLCLKSVVPESTDPPKPKRECCRCRGWNGVEHCPVWRTFMGKDYCRDCFLDMEEEMR